MTWVHRETDDTHRCPKPTSGDRVFDPSPIGREGDLWRCDDCGKLWRIGDACDYCDAHGHAPHGGQHAVGLKWREATWWQRRKYRKATA